jgi:hypothetical protein
MDGHGIEATDLLAALKGDSETPSPVVSLEAGKRFMFVGDSE